jgi:Icc protein
VNTEASFRATLRRALHDDGWQPDAIVVTGDIADDGSWQTYQRFRTAMGGLGIPVLCTPGNHEDPVAAAAVLNDPPLQLCGSAALGDWRLVLLSSHVPGDDSGWLAEHELERLERELAAAAEPNLLVCLHHQPLPVGSPWLDGVGLRNAAEMHEVLARHRRVRGVLFGHVHQAFDATHAGLRWLGTPSTCSQFTPQTTTCVMDLGPPGFRRVRLTPAGGIETEVVWLEELRRTERPPDSRPAAAITAQT